jgi:hypothetical protein
MLVNKEIASWKWWWLKPSIDSRQFMHEKYQ